VCVRSHKKASIKIYEDILHIYPLMFVNIVRVDVTIIVTQITYIIFYILFVCVWFPFFTSVHFVICLGAVKLTHK
jgi:hypothetical protein